MSYPEYPYFNGSFPYNRYNIPPQPQQSGSSIEGVRWVNGVDEVRSMPMQPGASALYMNSGSQEFYVKTVDQNGIASIKEFTFEEKPAEPDPREQIESLRKELEDAKSAIQQLTTQLSATADAGCADNASADERPAS